MRINLALFAVSATGMTMYKKTDDRTSNLGSLLVAGSVVAVAAQGG